MQRSEPIIRVSAAVNEDLSLVPDSNQKSEVVVAQAERKKVDGIIIARIVPERFEGKFLEGESHIRQLFKDCVESEVWDHIDATNLEVPRPEVVGSLRFDYDGVASDEAFLSPVILICHKTIPGTTKIAGINNITIGRETGQISIQCQGASEFF